jgi:hypothetical protein
MKKMNSWVLKSIKCLSLPFLIVFIHWISIYIYSRYCVPTDFYSIFTSMISTGSPICSTILTISEKTSSLYMSTWALIGVYILSVFNDFSKWFANSSKPQ